MSNMQNTQVTVTSTHDRVETLVKAVSALSLESGAPTEPTPTNGSQSPSSSTSRLHSIALRCIFDAIFPPSGFLDSALGRDSESPWCRALRTSKALTLVCRTWRSTALPFLYNEVVLRRVGQLSGLAATLRSNPELFGPLIRSLSLAFYVPFCYDHVTEECTAFILKQCPNLRTLSFTSAFVDLRRDTPIHTLSLPANPLLSAIHDLAPNISQFEFYSIDRAGGEGVPMSLITAFPNVVRLTLSFTWIDTPKIEQTIRLERLEHLSLWHTHTNRCRCSCVLPMMELPKLKRLCLHWLLSLPLTQEGDDILHFVEKNGRGLEYLDLSRLMFWPLTQSGFAQVASHSLAIVKACRSLTHLVFEDRYFDNAIFEHLNNAAAPVHVDVWAGPSGVPGDSNTKELRIRLLDRSLGRCPDLPRLLPPVRLDQVDRVLPCVHRVFGMTILETDRLVTRCPDDVDVSEGDWDALECLFDEWKWPDEGEGAGEDEDEEDGFPSDLPDPSSGSEFSNSDVGTASEGDEQVTQEEALAIFRALCASHGSSESSQGASDSEDGE